MHACVARCMRSARARVGSWRNATGEGCGSPVGPRRPSDRSTAAGGGGRCTRAGDVWRCQLMMGAIFAAGGGDQASGGCIWHDAICMVQCSGMSCVGSAFELLRLRACGLGLRQAFVRVEVESARYSVEGSDDGVKEFQRGGGHENMMILEQDTNCKFSMRCTNRRAR